jgi:hypothetical protein
MLGSFLQAWIGQQRDAAVAWIVTNSNTIAPKAVESAAHGLALENVDLAVSVLDQLPTGTRSSWIRSVGRVYGAQDPVAALAWADRFQGQPDYETAILYVALEAAPVAPALVGRALQDSGVPLNMGVASRVAAEWTKRDPAAAAQWAFGLSDPNMSSLATGAVLSTWLRDNADQAVRWALSLPESPKKDLVREKLLLFPQYLEDLSGAEMIELRLTPR